MITRFAFIFRLTGLWVAVGLLTATPSRAQTPRDFAVDLSAIVSTNAPCVTLSWSIRRQGNITAQKVHRRLKGETVWVKQADLATNQTSYVDNTAVPNVQYEYWMERTYTGIYPTTAMGYLSAGVNVPMVEGRGTLLLVIDNTMVAPLAPEIAQLQADLTGDGWFVQTITAYRTNTAANVKAQIIAAYDADPANVKMVYLLGHVPVPYSGNMAPDGHGNHVGAWPADGYYGELNGTWTDTSVNNTSASDSRNDNVPGDGKFDQNYFPNFVELMVGRVDLQGMTRAPSLAVSETALLRRYLRKAHDFRMKQGAYAAIPRRSIIRDGFGYFSGENFAIAGWGWAFTGSGSLIDEPPSGQWFSSSYAGGKTYLIGYGNGGGSYSSASTVGYTEDFGLKPSLAVFTSLFGSYFGDWDSANNFLRAPLAGNATGDSLGLTCFWGGRPNRFMHPLGMGETAGYGMWISQNGSLSGGGGYTPNSDSRTHTGLMGDPALRLYAVEPPRNVSAVSSNSLVSLNWSASSETGWLGYHVYRADSAAGPFTRLTDLPLAVTFYTDVAVTPGQSYSYLVRTLKRETVPGGSFDNLSVGSPATLTVNAGASVVPRNPGGLTVAPNSATNALLTWTDTSDIETGFRIERMTNAGGSFASVGTVAANVTNFTDTGVFAAGSVYYYRVVAIGASGDSLPSDVISFEAVAGYFDLPVTLTKVSKTAGSVSLTVNRFGGASGAASVNFATVNSSALAGTHYTATNGTLTWADGEAGAKIVTVPIINTAVPQAARQFKLTLSNPSIDTSLTVNSSVAVLIEDPTASLDAPWSQTVIGSLTDSSSAVTESGSICSVTIGGSGVAASSTTEAGQFVYQNRTGDGILTAYFPAGIPSDGNARYAVMVRASTANNAVMAAAVTSSTTSYGSRLISRSSSGGSASALPSAANTLVLARWMRLTRTGSVFSAETSSDGVEWTLLGSATLASMPSTAVWGIFHYSSNWSVSSLGNYHLAFAQNISIEDVPLPDTPTGLVAVAMSPVAVSLSWTTVANASGYRVERRTESGEFVQIADLSAGTGVTQSTADMTVTADTGYAYRICAYNASGTSGYSEVVMTATPQADIVTALTPDAANGADAVIRIDLPDTPLGTATNLTVAGYDPDTWAVLTNAAKTYVRFDLAGLTSFKTAKLKMAFLSEERFSDAGYFNLYTYALGESSDVWNEGEITWNNAPQNNLTGVGFSGSSMYLAYTNFYDIPAEGSVVTFALNASSLSAAVGSNNLVTLGLCQYSGGAIMHWASREHPSYDPPTLELSSPSPLPNRPSFLTAVVKAGWHVTLDWADTASDETGFELERRVSGGAFAPLQSLASNTVAFVDATAAPDTPYEYRLRAVNGSGASSWTVATVTTPDVFHAVGTLWDGGGIDDTLIDTPVNWDTDATPVFDGSLYFNFGSGGEAALANTDVSFYGMNLSRDADFTIFDGGGVLTLGAGGLRAVVPSALSRTYTVAANTMLASSQYWGVTNNGAGVTTLIVSGSVADGDSVFGITKQGNGVLTLAGNNSYDGTTVVITGVLAVAHNNALGSVTGATNVRKGGRLEIGGNVSVPEPLSLRGDGALESADTLRSTDGTNVWTGPVSQTVASRMRVMTGSRLTLSGGLTGSSAVYLSPDAGAELAFTGAAINVGSSGKIYANGAGTVAIGSDGNTFGTLEVAGLLLRTDRANTLPSSVTLALGTAYAYDGTFDLNGCDQTIAVLKRGTTGGSGVNRVVTSSAPATLTVSQNTSSVVWDGLLTGALSLKSGSTSLTLYGANTYSGSTIVSGGLLTVYAGSCLGVGTNIVVSGGTLKLQTSTAISDDATLSIEAGGAKVYLNPGVVETVFSLVLGGNRKPKGTYGATGSGADFIDDAYFLGTGVIYVPTGASTMWDGGGANTYVNTANNWDYDMNPAFDGSTYLTFGIGGALATINANVSFSGVRFNRDADFTISDGGGTLTLGEGGIWAEVPSALSHTYTLAANVALASNQTWGVTNNGTGVTSLTVSGSVADGDSSYGITKRGNGVLTLAGNSSYDGTTVVITGVLAVAHNNALGSTAGATNVRNGSRLEVGGNVEVPEPLSLRGDGTLESADTLRSTDGTNVWTGPVSQTVVSRIRVVTGSRLTLSGGLTGSSAVYLSPDAGAELAFSGAAINVGSSGKIYANGAGTVAIGSDGNTFGTLEVAGLLLRTDRANTLPSSVTLALGTAYAYDGAFDLNGYDQTIAILKRGTTGGSGANRVVTSSAPATLTVNQNSSAVIWDGLLTGALSLKSGSTSLTLYGANTYSGSTTVSGGLLTVYAGSCLGKGQLIWVTGGMLKLQTQTAIEDTATLRIEDGGAKVYVNDGLVETVGALYLGNRRARRGTWGAIDSGATYIDSDHFSGTGVIFVSHGPETLFMVQ